MATPGMNERCAVQACGHVFGDHATSFNGKLGGCLHVTPGYHDQRDSSPAQYCKCSGFAWQVKWTPPSPHTVDPQMTFNQRYEDDKRFQNAANHPFGGRVEQQWER